MDLTNDEVLRYSRHLLMPEVGVEGQKKLKAASVLSIGTGGLGAPFGLYMAAAGIGRLGLVDFDTIELTNLQRQVLYSREDVGRSKLQVAAQRLRSVNPSVEVVLHEARFTAANAEEIARNYDIVVDGTDNFPARYLANDVCVLHGKPNVYGSVFRFDGQASVFDARRGPCYRCLYPEPPPPGMVPSCAEGGVLGILPGIVGLVQATETIKLILGKGEPLIGRLLLFDALGMKFRELALDKDPNCPICGPRPKITHLIDYDAFCSAAAPAEVSLGAGRDVAATELKAALDSGSPPLVLDVREPHEHEICHIEGSRLMPLSLLGEAIAGLERDCEIVVYCHHGVRSRTALSVLDNAGFTRVKHLTGGIDSWSRTVDPKVPRY